MSQVDHLALPLRLDVLGAHAQHAHHARLLLALGLHRHHVPLLQLRARVRQAATGRRQPRRHERRPRQHEADGAAVDAHARKALRICVHNAQVGDQRVVHVLPEERAAVEGIEGGAVGARRRVRAPALQKFGRRRQRNGKRE